MDLRSRAEDVMRKKPLDHPDVATLHANEIQALVHELQVHQIEMQNDELKRVQLALETSRNEFQDLYDFAPVGCVAIYFSDGSMRLLQEMKIWMPPRY